MNIKEKLDLLSIAKDKFEIKEDRKDNNTITYEVLHLKADLAALITINDNENNISIGYYRTDCYNSGTEWLNIDIIALEELKSFCEFLTK